MRSQLRNPQPSMNESAQVHSLAAVTAWKDAVCLFGENGKDALVSVEMEIRRSLDWLDEQQRLWHMEVRRREDAVVQAKAELVRKKTMPIIRNPDTTEQEKALRRAQLRLEEAEEKVEAIRRWGPKLRQAIDEYQGPARQLSGWLEGDLPRAVALLARKIASLEAYIQIEK